jgi:uncharacterized protein GlcG (DUF336 family)
VYSRRTAQVNPFSQAVVSFVGSPFYCGFSSHAALFENYCIQKNNSLCSICCIGLRHNEAGHRLSEKQNEDGTMSALTLKVAVNLINEAINAGRAICAAPLTIAVLDAGGHLITLQREDGASLLRPHVAIGKAWGAIALGKGSRLLALDAQQRPAFIAALNSLGQGSVVPAPGGVLIRDQEGNVLGAVGISGDLSDVDEQCAINAIEALGLRADAGVVA